MEPRALQQEYEEKRRNEQANQEVTVKEVNTRRAQGMIKEVLRKGSHLLFNMQMSQIRSLAIGFSNLEVIPH